MSLLPLTRRQGVFCLPGLATFNCFPSKGVFPFSHLLQGNIQTLWKQRKRGFGGNSECSLSLSIAIFPVSLMLPALCWLTLRNFMVQQKGWFLHELVHQLLARLTALVSKGHPNTFSPRWGISEFTLFTLLEALSADKSLVSYPAVFPATFPESPDTLTSMMDELTCRVSVLWESGSVRVRHFKPLCFLSCQTSRGLCSSCLLKWRENTFPGEQGRRGSFAWGANSSVVFTGLQWELASQQIYIKQGVFSKELPPFAVGKQCGTWNCEQ